MQDNKAKDPIRIYLDDSEEPFKEEQPPLRFNFNTIQLPDGPHVLRVEASNGLAPPTIKKIPFTVRNGVALSVSGLDQGQTIGGQVELIINAFAGNTEVDFEPRQAETPTPVPTWAWVLLLGVIAWTMFYVLNPAQASQLVDPLEYAESELGERLYVDTCARCHGETGSGRTATKADGSKWAAVPPLRDTRTYALADSPLNLLTKVVQGVDGTMMPAWGPILDNDETVAVVNYIRTSWRHDASTINLSHRRAPRAITTLENDLRRALLAGKPEELARCCWPKGGRRPQLYRTDGVRARKREDVQREWENYFAALGPNGKVTGFELTEERYDYERATVDQDGSIVIGMGRIFLEAETQSGERVRENGRFIRVYQLWEGSWALVFDFADIPMNVGCEVDEDYCPPEDDPTITDPLNGAGGAVAGDAVGYKDIQQLFRAIGKSAGDAPHEDFWNWDYEKFCTETFSESYDDAGKIDNLIRLVEPGNVSRSNLLRALEGQPILVILPDGTEIERSSIARMPKNGPFLPPDVVAIVRRWVKDGCPMKAGGPPHSSADDAGGAPPPEPVADATPPTTPPVGGGASIGYVEVVALLTGLGKGAGDAPHEDFWKKPYKEFVEFGFEESWNETELMDNKIRLVVPWKPDESNLVRALEGKSLLVTLPDGSTEEHEKPQMPKAGPFMPAGDIAKIRAWIAAGCPETAGGAPFSPNPDGGAPPPAPGGGFPEPKGPAPDDK